VLIVHLFNLVIGMTTFLVASVILVLSAVLVCAIRRNASRDAESNTISSDHHDPEF
jgi:ABC-type protease/lipase transport system fused ATPase/permease subunit